MTSKSITGISKNSRRNFVGMYIMRTTTIALNAELHIALHHANDFPKVKLELKVLRNGSSDASAPSTSTRGRSRWARVAPPDVAYMMKVVEGDHVVAAERSRHRLEVAEDIGGSCGYTAPRGARQPPGVTVWLIGKPDDTYFSSRYP